MPPLGTVVHRNERAVSRGHAVPEGAFAGVVHSVFTHSCNLAVAGTLVTLHDSAMPHTPTSIRIAAGAGRRWHPTVGAGQPAWLADGLIRIGGPGADAYTLDISSVEVWRPRQVEQISVLDPALTRLRKVLDDHPLGGGNRPDLHAAADDLQRAFAKRMNHEAVGQEITNAAEALIGLGPGLTPSGDDLLVGLLGALMRGGGSRARETAGGVIAAIAAREDATTDVSRHYLRLATEGHFSQPLTELLDVLAQAAPPKVQNTCIQQVLSVGATSGSDAIAGVVLGLTVLAADELAADQSNVSIKENAL